MSGNDDLLALSRALMLDHASVAALLAPGGSVDFDEGSRSEWEDLAPFIDRSVVRIVRLSGLGDLSIFFFGIDAAA
jgi:hypothetical protein